MDFKISEKDLRKYLMVAYVAGHTEGRDGRNIIDGLMEETDRIIKIIEEELK